MIWENLIKLSNDIEQLFDCHFERFPITEKIDFNGWNDIFWKSDIIRKCHLKIIDNRSTQKLWLMHINIFSNADLNIPILGFDIVAGQNKITGSFFDYSLVDNHPFMDYYYLKVKDLSWNKPRELPEWAQCIFSNHMIAAGNIKTEEEINQLCTICFDLIYFYVTNLNNTQHRVGNYKDKQNYYCKQQKLNPHLHKSILAMGISEKDKNRYINKILFEELE